jgi:reversibly glycosylated polypeptide / UDP-arabinopyranose mutase
VKAVIVIPNHLPHLDFLTSWDAELIAPGWDVRVIVVQDVGELEDLKGLARNLYANGQLLTYSHENIEDDLGKDAWIIPSRTSACRSYGYYQAWQLKPDMILTLDNDCYSERPRGSEPYWLDQHWAMLNSPVTLDWVNTMGEIPGRGFPYGIRQASEVWLNHGIWSGVPDLDAATALHYPGMRLTPATESMRVPRHNFFPMCGMNLAWRPELTPALYFGLFGPDYGFDQYDDIWAGVLAKKVLDHLGYGVRSGLPSVEHRKQSNAFVNLVKQAPGLAMNEEFWRVVQAIDLRGRGDTVIDTYEYLISQLPEDMPGCPIVTGPSGGPEVPWLTLFKEAALTWLSLFR